LREAREAPDAATAGRVFKDAFVTDVHQFLLAAGSEMRLLADPLEAYRKNRYQEKIEEPRS